MSQAYFQIVDKLLFFGQSQRFCCPRDEYLETSENITAFQDFFFFFAQKSHDIIACEK